MTCIQTYAALPCSSSGIAYTASTLNSGDTTLKLRANHHLELPVLDTNQVFNAYLFDGCSDICEQLTVTKTDGDLLTLQRFAPSSTCFSTNSRLCYTTTSIEAIETISKVNTINVISPLVYNCESNTLSIDCDALEKMISRIANGSL